MFSLLLFFFFFFFNDTATTEIYTVSDTLSLHDALPILRRGRRRSRGGVRLPATCSTPGRPGRCTRRSEEHTSELQSPDTTSYAVFCLKKKKIQQKRSPQHSRNHSHNTQ